MKGAFVSQHTYPSRSGADRNLAFTESRTSALNLHAETDALLGKLGSNHVEPVAYDTAWLARLDRLDHQLAKHALEWLRANQMDDGSWGAAQPRYHHDRVICTLSALVALARNGEREDQPRIKAALPALHDSMSKLDEDIAGRTIAFEMLLPALVSEAETFGLKVNAAQGVVQKMSQLRGAKLARAPKGLISRGTTLGFSAEMVGPDGLHLLDSDDLQLDDGSLSASPAATAFYATYVRPDASALQYLREVAPQGGAPAITAIDVFERGWGIWNLHRAGVLDATYSAQIQPLLDLLATAWTPGKGIPPASSFAVQDGDDTGLVYEVLTSFGRAPDLEALWRYEEEEYFRCYDLESHASISTNIHILGAFRQAGLPATHPAIQKIVRFLHSERNVRDFWEDKWHASPYYPTSHAIMVCAGYLNQLVDGAIEWLVATQNLNGSWGYHVPTAEETAYCLQALITCHQQGMAIPRYVLDRGVAWLAEHADAPYPPLWIGKCLYCPTLVVRSAVLGALWQYENVFGRL